jgi:putative hydrolase of the HAD superfamily
MRKAKAKTAVSTHVAVLDASGVLILPSHERVSEAVRQGGLEPDPALRSRTLRRRSAVNFARDHDVYVTYVPDYARSLEVADEIFPSVVHRLHALFAVFGSWTRVVDDSARALRCFAQMDLRVGIVSNTRGELAGRLAGLGLCHVGDEPGVRIEAVIDSQIVGVEKPDPRIFELALEMVASTRGRALNVGDSVYFDVEGAEAADVRGIHLDPFGLCKQESHPHVDRLSRLLESDGPAALRSG